MTIYVILSVSVRFDNEKNRIPAFAGLILFVSLAIRLDPGIQIPKNIM